MLNIRDIKKIFDMLDPAMIVKYDIHEIEYSITISLFSRGGTKRAYVVIHNLDVPEISVQLSKEINYYISLANPSQAMDYLNKLKSDIFTLYERGWNVKIKKQILSGKVFISEPNILESLQSPKIPLTKDWGEIELKLE